VSAITNISELLSQPASRARLGDTSADAVFFEKQSKKEKTENFMVNFVFYDNSCLLLNLTDFQQSNRGVVDWLIS